MFGYFCESRLPPLGNSFLNFVEEEGSSDEEGVLLRSHSFAGYIPHKMEVLMHARLVADRGGANACEHISCKVNNETVKCVESLEKPPGSPCCRIIRKSSDETRSAEHQVSVNAANSRKKTAANAAVAAAEAAAAAARAVTPATAAATAAAPDQEVSTLLLQNLPRNISQDVLSRIITSMGFGNDIDFLYAPSEFGTLRCKGVAFVNFASSAVATNFASAWLQEKPLGSVVRGRRPVRILPASLQGYDANVRAWERATRQRIRNPSHRPLVASEEGMMVPYAGKAKHGLQAA